MNKVLFLGILLTVVISLPSLAFASNIDDNFVSNKKILDCKPAYGIGINNNCTYEYFLKMDLLCGDKKSPVIQATNVTDTTVRIDMTQSEGYCLQYSSYWYKQPANPTYYDITLTNQNTTETVTKKLPFQNAVFYFSLSNLDHGSHYCMNIEDVWSNQYMRSSDELYRNTSETCFATEYNEDLVEIEVETPKPTTAKEEELQRVTEYFNTIYNIREQDSIVPEETVLIQSVPVYSSNTSFKVPSFLQKHEYGIGSGFTHLETCEANKLAINGKVNTYNILRERMEMYEGMEQAKEYQETINSLWSEIVSLKEKSC